MKNLFQLFLIPMLFASFSISAQLPQLGNDIDGIAQEQFGYTVSSSDEGTTIAVGAPYADVSATDIGLVRVYQSFGSTWTQMGSDIVGENSVDLSGYAVDLSDNGFRVVIGAPLNNGNGFSNAGHARVYEYNGGSWTQLGSDIDGLNASDLFGEAVAISGDGGTIVIGASNNDDNGLNAGQVRIFDWDGTDWVQVGNPINGEDVNDNFGFTVAVSSDGNVISSGAPNNNDLGFAAGQARVFERIGGSWTQVGADLNGSTNDAFGTSTALNSTGSRLLVGATSHTGGIGYAEIYDYDGSAWTLVGSRINGDSIGDQFGACVSMSGNGLRVAVGAPNNSASATEAGHIKVLEYNGSTWDNMSTAIEGEGSSDQFGSTCALSTDGERIIGGSSFNSGNGTLAGHARVYCLARYYEDTDSDGYGNPISFEYACTPSSGYVSFNTDCDDTDPSISPSSMEICDGIDNNCDGQIDEVNCPCANSLSGVDALVLDSTQVVIVWDTSGSAGFFKIQYRLKGTTTWTLLNVKNTTFQRKYWTISNLSKNTTYEYRVRQQCPYLTAGPYSTIKEFTTFTTSVCDIPDKSAIGYSSDPTKVVFFVDYEPNATKYNVRWRKVGFSGLLDSKVAAKSRTAMTGLTPNTTYEYRYRAKCSGIWTSYSDWIQFTTNPGGFIPRENFSELGKNQFTKEDIVNIYPNPAQELLYLNFDKEDFPNSIRILNTQGQLQASIKHSIQQIDVSDLPKGNYLVQCIWENDVVVLKKFIKI